MLSTRRLAETALKLYGVYWLVLTVAAIPQGLTWWLQPATGPEAATSHNLAISWAVATVVDGLIGGALIAFASRIASRLEPIDDTVQVLTASRIGQAAALSVLGVYFFCSGVATTGNHLFNFLTSTGHEQWWGREEFIRKEWAWLCETGLRIVIGVVLFFGGRGLAGIWHRLRPLDEPPPSDQAS